MTVANVRKSLEAVEQALDHLLRSLERAGFEAGAHTYRRMTDVVISQFFWIQDQGLEDDTARFRGVADLAGQIYGQLEPYATCMKRLASLGELSSVGEIDPHTLTGRVVRTIAEAERPLSLTAIQSAVESSSRAVRNELSALVSSGAVREVRSGSRVLFASAQDG